MTARDLKPEPGSGAIRWPVPGAVPALSPFALNPGDVHVWGWRVDSALSGAEGVLSPSEIARTDRLISKLHRTRFVAAHIGVRKTLARYLQVEPASIEFVESSQGKPQLAGASKLKFNLSHSGDIAVLAVSDGVEVGVDVELVRPISEKIGDRFFSASEVAALTALPQEDRLLAFYGCWTRKEAFLKGLGLGISGGLNAFSVSLPGQGPPVLRDSGSGITAGWRLFHLEPAPGYIGALALRSEHARVSCFQASIE